MKKKYTPISIEQIKQKLNEAYEESGAGEVDIGPIILIVLVIWAAIIGISSFIARGKPEQKKKTSSTIKNNSSKTNIQQETDILLKKVGELYDLPTGEVPTVATVSDKTKLQKQSFFMKAENGDKVIIYTNAKKAILYRPSIHKIMEIAPLALKGT